jgi:phosphate transport system permease protein
MSAFEAGQAGNPLGPLAASGNLRRRRRTDRLMRGVSTGAAVIAVAILVIVIVTVAEKGASQLSIPFLTHDPKQTLLHGLQGGIANALVGSGLIIALGAAMALPIGVLIAVYLTEFSTPRTARPIRLVLDLLNGMPSIVIGVFVYGLLIQGSGESGWAGSFALAIIMVPLVARATSEMLLLVPRELRDASHALGMSRWRTIVGIVLPSALGGILTGTVLAIARAAGETAPLLLTNGIFSNSTTINIFGTSLPNIPVTIFSLSESAVPSDHARAWGAALVLIVLILIGNLSARAMLERQRRKIQAR